MDMEAMLAEWPDATFVTVTRQESAVLNELAVAALFKDEACRLREQSRQLRRVRTAARLQAPGAGDPYWDAGNPNQEHQQVGRLR